MSSRDRLPGKGLIVALNVFGVASMALAIGNAILFTQNRSAQAEINVRAQFLQQSVQLEVLYRNIVKAIAELSVKSNDPKLMEILSTQGISVSVNKPSTLAGSAALSPATAVAPKR